MTESRIESRRQSDKVLTLWVQEMERRLQTFEQSHRTEYLALRAEMGANTALTQDIFNRLQPYLENIEAMGKFTEALSTIADGLNWFIRGIAKCFKPIAIIAGLTVGILALAKAWRNGDLIEILLAIGRVFS